MERKGYHYRKKKGKKKRPACATLRRKFLSSFMAAFSLLLTSSVHVATLAMQPRQVELWKCRVQHLRRVHCKQDHKQRGTGRGVYSGQLHYVPFLVMLWCAVMSATIFLASYLDLVTNSIGMLQQLKILPKIITPKIICKLHNPACKLN